MREFAMAIMIIAALIAFGGLSAIIGVKMDSVPVGFLSFGILGIIGGIILWRCWPYVKSSL